MILNKKISVTGNRVRMHMVKIILTGQSTLVKPPLRELDQRLTIQRFLTKVKM